MSDIRMEDEKTFGGCEGPDAMYVKLISSDGHEFIVKRDHALTSGTIKAMLSGPGVENLLACKPKKPWLQATSDQGPYMTQGKRTKKKNNEKNRNERWKN